MWCPDRDLWLLNRPLHFLSNQIRHGNLRYPAI